MANVPRSSQNVRTDSDVQSSGVTESLQSCSQDLVVAFGLGSLGSTWDFNVFKTAQSLF